MARGETAYAVLNLYPYNSGHLMVVPYRHVPDYTRPHAPRRPSWAARPAMRAIRAVSVCTGSTSA